MEFFVSLIAVVGGYLWFENKYLKGSNQEKQVENEEELRMKIREQERIAEEQRKRKERQQEEKKARIAAIKLETDEQEKLRIKFEEKERERIELEMKAEEERKLRAKEQAEKEVRIAASKLKAAQKEMLRLKREKEERERIAEEFKTQEDVKDISTTDKSQDKSTNANLDSSSAFTPRGNSPEHPPSFNSGIFELDGPGVWRKLHAYTQGHALYLLFSAEHDAYKVGVSEPDLLANRIKEIKKHVPDIRLNGLAVLTSRQKAFDKEQEVLEKYKEHKYKGIQGRYLGSGEWITIRPSGRPYFTSPEKIEETFRRESEASAQELIIPDNYTVYLLYSKSKNAYKCSWCNSKNLQKKIEVSQKKFASDVQLVSRIRVEAANKARAIAQTNNTMSSSFFKEGRLEEYQWKENPEYLQLFEKWDRNVLPKKIGNKSL